jgi:hypothetical protein
MLKDIDFISMGFSAVTTCVVFLILAQGPGNLKVPQCIIDKREFQCSEKIVTIEDQLTCLKRRETVISLLKQCVDRQEAFLKKFRY